MLRWPFDRPTLVAIDPEDNNTSSATRQFVGNKTSSSAFSAWDQAGSLYVTHDGGGELDKMRFRRGGVLSERGGNRPAQLLAPSGPFRRECDVKTLVAIGRLRMESISRLGSCKGSWELREGSLASRMLNLILRICPNATLGLDVGAQDGALASEICKRSRIKFYGVEPFLGHEEVETNTVIIRRGWAHSIPFENGAFDVVLLTSVYEHILPRYRLQSMKEIHRVLKSGGVLVGQIPNMYLPIEVHSKLPFQQYLPRSIGNFYCQQFSPEPWRKEGAPSWFRVGPKNLVTNATKAGFKAGSVYGANYPSDAIPRIFRGMAFFSRVIPIGFDFYFRT
jgi:SAM-dependent methyltransferase